MSDEDRFERLVADVLSDAAPTRVPDRLVPDILAAASHTRRRPRWFALATEPPMRRRAEVLVGSPTVRLAYPLVIAALLTLLAVAALVVGGGIVRPQELSVVVVPSPSVKEVAPSSTPSQQSALPTASPVTDPAGVWIATGMMRTPRHDHTAVRLLDGRVLVLGGSSGDGSDATSAELYDPLTGTWSATGTMIRPHLGFSPTLLRDGRVLVGTALDGDRPGAELYDPNSGTWSATGQMVRDADFVGDTATLLPDGRVLVIGLTAGNPPGSCPANSVCPGGGAELYDPDSGTWTATGKMIAPRYYATATVLPDGKVLVAGGFVIPDIETDVAELYDPNTGSWTAIANAHAWSGHHMATLLPDGKVLVVGMGDPQSAELYDPDSGTWTDTGDLSRLGVRHEFATLLHDGRVLLTGYDGTAELYDPATGSWSTAAPMLRPHGPAPILLLDGTVLVAGGNDCLDGVCVATGTAELYVPAGVAPPQLPAFPPPPPPVIPTPTPRPTPFPPEAGPVPPNARPWTVTVVNESAQPVTVVLAGNLENGRAQLCGSVTPNLVPAGATIEVIFQLPAKNIRGCWATLNLRPGEEGGFFETSDAPMAGNFRIRPDGVELWGGS
jgi:Kelch motif/Galactose oxidase, central domain